MVPWAKRRSQGPVKRQTVKISQTTARERARPKLRMSSVPTKKMTRPAAKITRSVFQLDLIRPSVARTAAFLTVLPSAICFLWRSRTMMLEARTMARPMTMAAAEMSER